MRVGRPVKPLPHPNCDYCNAPATLTRAGDEAYPYRDDHGPLWMCAASRIWRPTNSSIERCSRCRSRYASACWRRANR